MIEACLFEIIELPEESLRKALPKASVRAITHLLAAYPRAIGHTLLDILTDTMSPATLRFLREEMQTAPAPSMEQVREAEQEMVRILREENLLVETVCR